MPNRDHHGSEAATWHGRRPILSPGTLTVATMRPANHADTEGDNSSGGGGNLTLSILSIYNYYYSPIDFLRREYPTYNTFPCIFIGLLLHFSPTEVGHSSTSLLVIIKVSQFSVLSVGKQTPTRYRILVRSGALLHLGSGTVEAIHGCAIKHFLFNSEQP